MDSICPKCGCELNVEETVREHAEDYGYVKLPDVNWLTEFFAKRMAKEPTANLNFIQTAQDLHTALQGGKHA